MLKVYLVQYYVQNNKLMHHLLSAMTALSAKEYNQLIIKQIFSFLLLPKSFYINRFNGSVGANLHTNWQTDKQIQ